MKSAVESVRIREPVSSRGVLRSACLPACPVLSAGRAFLQASGHALLIFGPAARTSSCSRMAVRPDDHDRRLDKTGQHRRRRGTGDAKCRRAEFAVNQNIIPDQIDKDRRDAGLHRHDRLAALTQRAGVDLRQGKRKKSRVHHQKILPGGCHRRASIHAPAVAGEPEPHQILPLQRKQHRTRRGQDQSQHEL